MRALVKTDEGVALEERELPSLAAPDSVRIAVHRAAICRTDLYAAEGRIKVERGRVLGHEFAGVVESTGTDVTHVTQGDHVLVNPFLPCGQCAACAAHQPHFCDGGEFLGISQDGAFADFALAPASQVVAMPADLPFELGAYAEPLAAMMAVLDAGLLYGERIAVVGSGRIAEITRTVLSNHGFEHVSLCESASGNNRFDAVVEAGIESAEISPIIAMLCPGGKLVLKSRTPGLLEFPPMEMIRKRITLRSVYYAEFNLAVRYLSSHASQIEPFIGRAWRLEDYEEAFRDARSENAKVYFAIRD
jgi:threonine dehydrogenase-like Zn-dependent dehydrogenase